MNEPDIATPRNRKPEWWPRYCREREARRYGRPVTDDAAVIRAYRVGGATLASVGKAFGLSAPGVLKVLRRNSVATRGHA